MNSTPAEMFKDNPALFLEKAVKKFITSSKGNCLPAFSNEVIFDEPLVGFADGDDAIFKENSNFRLFFQE